MVFLPSVSCSSRLKMGTSKCCILMPFEHISAGKSESAESRSYYKERCRTSIDVNLLSSRIGLLFESCLTLPRLQHRKATCCSSGRKPLFEGKLDHPGCDKEVLISAEPCVCSHNQSALIQGTPKFSNLLGGFSEIDLQACDPRHGQTGFANGL